MRRGGGRIAHPPRRRLMIVDLRPRRAVDVVGAERISRGRIVAQRAIAAEEIHAPAVVVVGRVGINQRAGSGETETFALINYAVAAQVVILNGDPSGRILDVDALRTVARAAAAGDAHIGGDAGDVQAGSLRRIFQLTAGDGNGRLVPQIHIVHQSKAAVVMDVAIENLGIVRPFGEDAHAAAVHDLNVGDGHVAVMGGLGGDDDAVAIRGNRPAGPDDLHVLDGYVLQPFGRR